MWELREMKAEESRTYVMGFWPVAENTKNSLDHYSRYITLSLEMLSGENLFFMSGSDTVISSVKVKCERVGIKLHCEKMSIHDLSKHQYMETLLQRTKNFGERLEHPPANFKNDKGLSHYWRDLRTSGEQSFRQMFSIWHSKIDLLRRASLENRFGSRQFAWVDASVSRFNHQRFGWDFRQLPVELPNTVYHYPNMMRKNGRQLAINASFLLGDAKAGESLQAAYDEAFAASLEEDYPNDEETVLDTVVSRMPRLFHAISEAEPPSPILTSRPAIGKPAASEGLRSPSAGKGKQKALVVGTFRCGTNAMKKCLEDHFDVEVTFNEWFWKHGLPPTGIQCQIPRSVPIVVMSKSPANFQESLYPFWLHRRPNLRAGRDISTFIRSELLVYDNSNGDFSTPKYWYRSPTDYWNQFYFAWLSWHEVRSTCRFVRYEDFAASPDSVLSKLASAFNLVRSNAEPVRLPAERVGPHVPTDRDGQSYVLKDTDRQWIRRHTNASVAMALRYET